MEINRQFNKEGKERYVEDFDPEKTLGKQWQWLKDKLKEDSDAKIIISSL